MWSEARKIVEGTFFHDTVEIFRNNVEVNDLGEETRVPVSLGEFPCNIENNASTVKQSESGVAVPQTLRISTQKTVPLDYSSTYMLVIKSARIVFDNTEKWDVDGWVEGQLSTVITASRRVDI